MTFEEYWDERTQNEEDIIGWLWMRKSDVGDNLYNVLKHFSKQVWEDCQKSSQQTCKSTGY